MTEKPNLIEFKRGWKILLACFLGIGISAPSLYIYTAGIWVISWQNEFGWSRGEIGLGQGLVSLVSVLGTPFIGMIIDRFGFRKIGVISLLLYGSCFYGYSQMNGSLLVFYLFSVLMALTALPSSPIGFTKTINRWFAKNRGLALGITLSAIGLGAIIIPKYLTPYVATTGWRNGLVILFLIVIIATPLVWLLLKDAPETESREKQGVEGGISLREAMKTSTFWKIGLIFFLISTALLGLIPNFIPMLQDEGMTAAEAGGMMAVLGVSVVFGRVFIGFLIDRFSAANIAIIAFILSASGCLVVGLWQTHFILWGAISIGLAIGAEIDLVSYFTARYFGLRHYGSIFGTLYSILVGGAVISPVLIGYSWDITGNYNLAFLMAVVIIILALLVIASLPRIPQGDQH